MIYVKILNFHEQRSIIYFTEQTAWKYYLQIERYNMHKIGKMSSLQISAHNHLSSTWNIFASATLNRITQVPLEIRLQDLSDDSKNAKIRVRKALK